MDDVERFMHMVYLGNRPVCMAQCVQPKQVEEKYDLVFTQLRVQHCQSVEAF